MRQLRNSHVAAFALGAAGFVGVAVGQTIYPPVKVNPNDISTQWRDATLALGPSGEVVVATARANGPQQVRYGISFDNGATFQHTQVLSGLPLPSLIFEDGTFWLTMSEATQITLSAKPAGATSFQVPGTIVPGNDLFVTLPRAAAGPDPQDPSRTRVYVVHNNGSANDVPGCSGNTMRLMASARWEGPDVEDWTAGLRISPPGNACEYEGNAPAAGVTDTGRLLALSADRSTGAEAWRNGGLPWVVYSSDAGSSWTPTAILLGENASPPIAGPLEADAVGIDNGAHFPNIAVKRRPGTGVDDHVYATFVARAPQPTQDNLDIYISRSVNGGDSFPSSPVAGIPNPNLVHLSDLDLFGEPASSGGPDQIMPAIAAGVCDNDVHLFWYNTPDNAQVATPSVTPYYARIRNYGTPAQTLTVMPIADPFGVETYSGEVLDLGRRQAIEVRKVGRDLWVYIAYIATYDGQSLFVQRIKWPNDLCVADMNLNGMVEAEDVVLFQAAYTGQHESADLNEDSVVDTADLAAFVNAFTGGCGQ